jgi:hypothetical protein
MAIINPSFVDLSQKFFGNIVVVYTWLGLANGDSGTPISGPGWADRSFQVEGTFGTGGTCLIEGSNDAVNYHVLHDPYGNLLSITANGVAELTEVTLWIRPRASAGDGTTLFNISAVFARHGYP